MTVLWHVIDSRQRYRRPPQVLRQVYRRLARHLLDRLADQIRALCRHLVVAHTSSKEAIIINIHHHRPPLPARLIKC